MDPVTDSYYRSKARAFWDRMDANQQAAAKFGNPDPTLMAEAEAEISSEIREEFNARAFEEALRECASLAKGSAAGSHIVQ
jgi:NAD(P)H-hydrate repair Nnr-like enzyme with NAD(P)H-hydrate epimerase domain